MIRSILHCLPRSQTLMTRRSLPAKICSHAGRRQFGAVRRPKAQRDDVIQVDPPQAYGIVQYARTLDMLARHQWPRRLLFPHGGNQMSLAIAAGFGLGGAEPYSGVFGDFGGFADDAELKDGYLTSAIAPASASKARRGFTASCGASRLISLAPCGGGRAGWGSGGAA